MATFYIRHKMPVHMGEDTLGKFYQWGNSGKKYYFANARGAKQAKHKAILQGYAIMSTGWRETSRFSAKDGKHKGGVSASDFPHPELASTLVAIANEMEAERREGREIDYSTPDYLKEYVKIDPRSYEGFNMEDPFDRALENWDGDPEYAIKLFHLAKKGKRYIPWEFAYWYANYGNSYMDQVNEDIRDKVLRKLTQKEMYPYAHLANRG